jgi:DNA-binding transcriptional LysR family regulator
MLSRVGAPGDEVEPLPSRELAAFVAAVETGGIGLAADALSLTQSAVTKRIARLEHRLGTALLARSQSGVRPTQDGKALYPEAKAGLLALSRAARAVSDGRVAAEQQLALAASHTIGTFLLPRWLGSFALVRPRARPQVSIVNSEAVLAAVREGEVEIGFAPQPARASGLQALSVGRDELVVVVATRHRFARADSVSLAELASEPFLTREPGSGTRAAAIATARELGVELKPALETGSIEALKRSVLDGGFTILSTIAIETEQAAGQLRGLRIDGAHLTRELLAAKHPDTRLGRAATHFWSWLANSREMSRPPI